MALVYYQPDSLLRINCGKKYQILYELVVILIADNSCHRYFLSLTYYSSRGVLRVQASCTRLNRVTHYKSNKMITQNRYLFQKASDGLGNFTGVRVLDARFSSPSWNTHNSITTPVFSSPIYMVTSNQHYIFTNSVIALFKVKRISHYATPP